MTEKSELRRPIRVAVLNTHPIQYFAPLYAYLARRVPEIHLTVLYCSDSSLRGAVDAGFERSVQWDIDLLAGYEYRFLGSAARTRTPAGFWSLVVPEVWSELRSGQYDVLWLHGYGYFACVLSFIAAKSMGMPVLLRGETHLSLSRRGWRRWLRDRLLRRASAWIDAFLAIGSRNRDYYRSLGVEDSRIHLVPYSVDNQRFTSAAQMTDLQRTSMRKKLGFTSDIPIVLYASKLVERKHPHTLMKAVSQLQQQGVRLGLCYVGSGPMEPALRQLETTLGLTDCVYTGFVNQSELPAVYAACDIFVLAAESEPWGLVVNEVMCAGLPVIIGEQVGCAADLVVPGKNGCLVSAGDVDELARAISGLAQDAVKRNHMRAESRVRMAAWGFPQCAEGLAQAVRRVGKSAQSRAPEQV
ncbi:MAG: glycosyltransferase family 4 protein [Lysobacterales bacterium]